MNHKKNRKSSTEMISVIAMIQIILISLKLIGIIDWSWWCVLSPTLFWVGLILLLVIIFVIITAITSVTWERDE